MGTRSLTPSIPKDNKDTKYDTRNDIIYETKADSTYETKSDIDTGLPDNFELSMSAKSDENKSPENKLTYVDLFDLLLKDVDGAIADMLPQHKTITERLANATKGRVWLWTKMTADEQGLYRSKPAKTAQERHELSNLYRKPDDEDPPEIKREMETYANEDDDKNEGRRKILRLGREKRHDLLRDVQ